MSGGGGVKPKKNPVLTAAVLKTSLKFRGGEARIFQEIYEGVLRDFSLTDEEVDAYIEAHRDEVFRLARGDAGGGDG